VDEAASENSGSLINVLLFELSDGDFLHLQFIMLAVMVMSSFILCYQQPKHNATNRFIINSN
jgi:hypothetical protein